MYRTRKHYIFAALVVFAFVFSLPHGRASILAWFNGGWLDTVEYVSDTAKSVKNVVVSSKKSLVDGDASKREWKSTDSWVRYISPGTTYGSVYPIKIIRWLDGDTVDVIYNKKRIRVRLIGVDTFETHNNSKMKQDSRHYHKSVSFLLRLGHYATQAVKEFIPENSNAGISFDGKPKKDKYGRILAYIHHPDGYVINEVLIKKGFARVWSANSKNTLVYKALETKARLNKVGIWKYI